MYQIQLARSTFQFHIFRRCTDFSSFSRGMWKHFSGDKLWEFWNFGLQERKHAANEKKKSCWIKTKQYLKTLHTQNHNTYGLNTVEVLQFSRGSGKWNSLFFRPRQVEFCLWLNICLICLVGQSTELQDWVREEYKLIFSLSLSTYCQIRIW